VHFPPFVWPVLCPLPIRSRTTRDPSALRVSPGIQQGPGRRPRLRRAKGEAAGSLSPNLLRLAAPESLYSPSDALSWLSPAVAGSR
jgi:hypothetical protein